MVGSKAHLLVVGDDTLSSRIVEQKLKAEGYAVSTASDGSAALHILAKGTVDMVVADHRAPKCDSVELLRAINDSQMTMPVVITANDPVAKSALSQWSNLAIHDRPADPIDHATQVVGAVASILPVRRSR